MKILNLYAGIGGNRKLWGDGHEVTAVEFVPEIAAVYQTLFPNDTVIVGDAHQYLLEHYKDFDFIWASPPCPTHSRLRSSHITTSPMVYPDMSLYQEIIFLQKWFKGNWVVENVIPYYEPLIKPTANIDRHLIWSNKPIEHKEFIRNYDISRATKEILSDYLGIALPEGTKDQRKLLRNAVAPEFGKYILEQVSIDK